jgi:hypothetical protein
MRETEERETNKQLIVNHDFLIAYQCSPEAPLIRSARPDREWMDNSHQRFVYRCLPMVIANQFGWDIINPVSFVASWNGGAHPNDVKITFPSNKQSNIPQAHFGAATLTFTLGHLFRTPPGVNLYVKGPTNSPKDGIIPLEGIVETDFSPATFTMNWLFTRKNHEVVFEAGESYCRIFPIPRLMTEVFEPEIRELRENQELFALHMKWRDERDKFNKGLAVPGSEYVERGWQKDYFKGGGTLFPPLADHQTRLDQREFKDCRFSKDMKDMSPDTGTRPMTLMGSDGRPLTLFVRNLRDRDAQQKRSPTHAALPPRKKPQEKDGGAGSEADPHDPASPGDGTCHRERNLQPDDRAGGVSHGDHLEDSHESTQASG